MHQIEIRLWNLHGRLGPYETVNGESVLTFMVLINILFHRYGKALSVYRNLGATAWRIFGLPDVPRGAFDSSAPFWSIGGVQLNAEISKNLLLSFHWQIEAIARSAASGVFVVVVVIILVALAFFVIQYVVWIYFFK